MAKIYDSVLELIGRTPLVRLSRLEQKYGLPAQLIAKLEYFNPAGSVKDRVALKMMEAAEAQGMIAPGATIIEPTSGNTGIGLASVAAARGYHAIFTMPETMSLERRQLLQAYGGEIVLTSGAKGMQGAIDKAIEIHEVLENSFIPGQFINPANPDAHRETTGPEIWEDTQGSVDFFVSAVGTGGTITGAGEYLKSRKPELRVVAVEPASSPMLSKGISGPHKIQGIGAGFVPDILNTQVYDQVIAVENDEAFHWSKEIAHMEGILAGLSSGAAIRAGIELARKPEHGGKTVVVLLPDTGERYLSTALF